jgi:hypothetical protein
VVVDISDNQCLVDDLCSLLMSLTISVWLMTCVIGVYLMYYIENVWLMILTVSG